MTKPLLQVDALRVDFSTKAGVAKAVDEVSFAVNHGEVLGLVGESGSGKSVTGYSIMGLVEPPGRIVGGGIVFAGRDLAALSAEQLRQLRGNRMALIFQDPTKVLNPVLRIDTQMVEAIFCHGKVLRSAALEYAREALFKLGVRSPDAQLKAYPDQLSGGVRQRVAIAIALLNLPDLIIADEPTSLLDATIRGQILSELQRLVRQTGVALICISRDLSLIAGLADRICVMYAGRVVEQGTTADVLGAPSHPYTRGLLDALPSNASPRAKLRQIPGMTPALTEVVPGCAFRPRCPYATAECAQTPEMRPYGAMGGSVRCFHPLSPPA